jgi:predicted DNA-binding protein|tara:strand:- start:265 stop:474 length:210 start_codon:yes stop_codon:yes gene_type:complete
MTLGNHMDRPSKLEEETTKYSILLPTYTLDALKAISQSEERTTATVIRKALHEFIIKHPALNLTGENND